jgi:dienelactone hydrolase
MATMDSIMAPASILTTIFVKPVLVLKVISSFIPFVFFCRESVTKPRIISYLQALRTDPETSNLKIGVAGFCWGGLHAVKLAQDAPSTRAHRVGAESGQLQPLADVVYTAHPSMVAVPADFEKVTIPLSVAVGDVDFAMKLADSTKAKDILEKKGDDHEVVIYPGGKHGFAVRGDPSDPTQKELAEQAEAQALAWFKRWIG